MIQAGRAMRWGRAVQAFPGVQGNVVVVSACRQKRCRIAHALRDRKSQYVAVKGKRAIQVGDLEMDVTDAGLWMNGGHNFQMMERQKRCADSPTLSPS